VKIPVAPKKETPTEEKPFNLLAATTRGAVERHAFDGKEFHSGATEIPQRGGPGWERIPAA